MENIVLGKDQSESLFSYERADGTIVSYPLGEHIELLMKDMIAKVSQMHNFLFKQLVFYNVTAEDRRWARNIQR